MMLFQCIQNWFGVSVFIACIKGEIDYLFIRISGIPGMVLF